MNIDELLLNELNRLKKMDKYLQSKIVAIQLPEGLKTKVDLISNELKGKDIIFLGDPFWGACDIPPKGNYDILVQFGHSIIPNLGEFGHVIFLEMQKELEFNIDISKIPFKSVVLTSNVTYSNQLIWVKDELERNGIRVDLRRGDSRVFYPGQILGCNISAARGNGEGILFIGEGLFHPLGIALALDKPVLSFNPVTNEYVDMEPIKKKFLKQRYAAIDISSRANNFGIIVSSKIGQVRYTLAKKAQEMLMKHGKSSFIVVMDLIRNEEIINFPADVYVNTACPRVTIEDYSTFSKPIITYYELSMALGEKDKSKYILDEISLVDEIGSVSFWGRDKSPGHN